MKLALKVSLLVVALLACVASAYDEANFEPLAEDYELVETRRSRSPRFSVVSYEYDEIVSEEQDAVSEEGAGSEWDKSSEGLEDDMNSYGHSAWGAHGKK